MVTKGFLNKTFIQPMRRLCMHSGGCNNWEERGIFAFLFSSLLFSSLLFSSLRLVFPSDFMLWLRLNCDMYKLKWCAQKPL
jgi:hypothetical protein